MTKVMLAKLFTSSHLREAAGLALALVFSRCVAGFGPGMADFGLGMADFDCWVAAFGICTATFGLWMGDCGTVTVD